MTDLQHLEHIAASPSSRRPPVILVPGAFTAAWLWEDNFQPWFVDAGYDTHTLTFAGHGQSLLGQARYGLDDHLRELLSAIDAMPQAPILVGYSLGGLTSALALRERQVAAAILIAPVPVSGFTSSLLAYARRHPVSAFKLASLSVFPPFRHLGEAPVGIYSESIPNQRQRATTQRLAREPLGALLATLRPRPGFKPTCPVLVIGAEGDHLIPPDTVRQAAQDLEAPCRIYPGMSHSLMLEPNARTVFDDLLQWIAQHTVASDLADVG